LFVVLGCRGKEQDTPAPPPPQPAVAAAAPVAKPLDPHLITDHSVGPITFATEVNEAALAKLVPDLAWMSQDDNDAEGAAITHIVGSHDGKDILAVRRGDDGHVAAVMVEEPGYATAAGVGVGATVLQLASAYTDLECRHTITETDELTCRSASLAHVVFHLEIGDRHMPEGKLDPQKLGRRRVEEIALAR
jgi:hypothetical protein